MFLSSENRNATEGRVTLIGEFVKIEKGNIIIRSSNELFTVVPKNLDNFKSKFLLVVGELRDNLLYEEHVKEIAEGFDVNSFQRLAKVSLKYPELF